MCCCTSCPKRRGGCKKSFDSISYDTGARLLVMESAALGVHSRSRFVLTDTIMSTQLDDIFGDVNGINVLHYSVFVHIIQ